ncbi:aromatic amino acid transaminase [Propionicicella superfundia]|uniref:amino acid aminotransferase n=1 Tax=Propionicicella superfundia TaxID=348582 RepID=UPI000400E9A6|nr:amino acid aminotransferase [Propionicicella superfundia]
MSIFSSVELAPADPILGLTEQFLADASTQKVNLGVGVYQDETGRVPLLECVRRAETEITPAPRPYLPIVGLPAYTGAVRELVFGADSPAVAEGRVTTVQTLSGTGALKVGADLLRAVTAAERVLISDPSWENHRALFTRAGFQVGTYAYYTPQGVAFDRLLADLRAAAPGTVVVLHACCHNPTGFDLTPAQWDQVVALTAERDLVPFVDMAYQGFAAGLVPDAAAIARFAASGRPFLAATSFSKSMGLYGERVGALSIVTASPDEAARVASQVKIAIRTNYSSPPTHGAAVAARILTDPSLRAMWDAELTGMRDRIRQMRRALADALVAAGFRGDVSFATAQTGMFSYTGLSAEQMIRLRSEFGVYGTDRGRICVAALNPANVGTVAAAMAAVS